MKEKERKKERKKGNLFNLFETFVLLTFFEHVAGLIVVVSVRVVHLEELGLLDTKHNRKKGRKRVSGCDSGCFPLSNKE